MRSLGRALLLLPVALPACILSLDGLSDGTTSSGTAGAGGGLSGTVVSDNPVIGQDHADPMVYRVIGADGRASYVLATTIVGASGDMPAFTSTDLIHWKAEAKGLFDKKQVAGQSLALGGSYYCNVWSPGMVRVAPSDYLLAFTATRFASAQAPCPGYADDSGIYAAHASSPLGPFAGAAHPDEPVPLGPGAACPDPQKGSLPHSVPVAQGGCGGGPCANVLRTHADFFADPGTGASWMAYGWFTGIPPATDWEMANHGAHVSLAPLDAADPSIVRCDDPALTIHVGNPHDAATLSALAASCEGCDSMLSMTRDRQGDEMVRDGVSWGLVERPSVLRRGEWVYVLLTGSSYDSPYSHVYWVAAKSVEGLSLDSASRLMGRYLVPSDGQSFGGGSAVLGPDGESFYYVHNHLDSGPCKESGLCDRDVWVSPIEFEDRGDGRGDVWIKARFPAKDTQIRVTVP